MSEAMTNNEIEDVLSSIRRLVAQEARPKPERLVLTPAQRVQESAATVQDTRRQAGPDRDVPSTTPTIPERQDHLQTPDMDSEQQPAQAPERHPVALDPSRDVLSPNVVTPRAELEATISELESALAFPTVLSAVLTADKDSDNEAKREDRPEAADEPEVRTQQPSRQDEDLALIDEDELARLIARLVRDELRGQLGERITMQVRKLVRAEIAKALDERNLLG